MVQLVNDFIRHESIKKIHFVLMGNEAAHKRTTAALASQFKDSKDSQFQFFLTYYSFHEDGSASSFYDWNHQCSADKCQLVNAILTNNDFEDDLGRQLSCQLGHCLWYSFRLREIVKCIKDFQH